MRWWVAAYVGLFLLGWTMTAGANQTPWGEGKSDPRDLVISLVTFSPGDDVASWFGHTGIIVEDRRRNVSRVYNYGMFSFDRTMLMRFAMGRLWFWVAPTPVAATFDLYIREDRDVRVLELNIPEEKRAKMAAFLSENVRPENREYLYHHYDDNCSTRIRDVIDIGLDGEFARAYKDKPGRWTLREHTRRHSGHVPWMDWVLMFLMNQEIDEASTVWEEMFLPQELEHRVLNFEWVDEEGVAQPLVLREHLVYESENRQPPLEVPPRHWPWWLMMGTLVGMAGVAVGVGGRRIEESKRRMVEGIYHMVVGLWLGIPGTVLAVMAVCTEHTVTYWNQNLFWANPLMLVVAWLGIMVVRGRAVGRRWLVRVWSVAVVVMAMGLLVQLAGMWMPAFYQDTSLAMASFVPIILGSTAAAWMAGSEGKVSATRGGEESER